MRVLDRVRGVKPSWPLLAAAVFLVLYVGWIVYMTADRGVDAGLGVLVSWPTLVLLAALVIAPLAAIVVLVARLVRGGDGSDGESGGETITTSTFPM